MNRTNTAATHGMKNVFIAGVAPAGCFTAVVSVFMAHLQGKPFRVGKLGTKIPRLLAFA